MDDKMMIGATKGPDINTTSMLAQMVLFVMLFVVRFRRTFGDRRGSDGRCPIELCKRATNPEARSGWLANVNARQTHITTSIVDSIGKFNSCAKTRRGGDTPAIAVIVWLSMLGGYWFFFLIALFLRWSHSTNFYGHCPHKGAFPLKAFLS